MMWSLGYDFVVLFVVIGDSNLFEVKLCECIVQQQMVCYLIINDQYFDFFSYRYYLFFFFWVVVIFRIFLLICLSGS